MSETPRTDNTLEKLLDQRGTIGRHNCPEELVVLSRRFERELAAANARIRRLEEALESIVNAMPAMQEGGGLFWPRFTPDGDYAGEEWVSEMSVIQQMLQTASNAIHQAKETRP
jgi:uncharacterized protein YukE